MPTVAVRISSGEVVLINMAGRQLVGPAGSNLADEAYFTQLTDPTFVDGTDNVERVTPEKDGHRRQLGFQKHWDGSVVRNATQIEIDGYAAFEAADEDDELTEIARNGNRMPKKTRKWFIAILKLLRRYVLNRTNRDVNRNSRALKELIRSIQLLDNYANLPVARRNAIENLANSSDNLPQGQDLDANGEVVNEQNPAPVATEGVKVTDLRDEWFVNLDKAD